MTDEPRAMTTADVDWVVELAARRRRQIVRYAPRFWNPARDARNAHAIFLAGLIESPDVLSVRTDRGFVIGRPDRDRIVVDDLALEADSLWQTDGKLLLRQAASSGPLRVVCPVPEEARRTAVARLGLSAVETWWHRDLDRQLPMPEADGDPRILVEGADAVLVTAPPVYAPGGPVVFIRTAATAAALFATEQEAVRRGAVVSVVSQRPDDDALADVLRSAAYLPTTDFCESGRAK